jgi:ankyrin repeat protein
MDDKYNEPLPFDTALHQACLKGALDHVQRIIEAGKDVNGIVPYLRYLPKSKLSIQNIPHIDLMNASPLHAATLTGHFDIVQYLISHEALVNTRTKYQQISDLLNEKMKHATPLHLAIRFQRQDIAEYLLENGANPTMLASYRYYDEQVSIKYSGLNALHCSCIWNCPKIRDFLLRTHGSLAQQVTNQNKSYRELLSDRICQDR